MPSRYKTLIHSDIIPNIYLDSTVIGFMLFLDLQYRTLNISLVLFITANYS